MSDNAQRLARLGFVAKGLLWAVIALIAIDVSQGDRKKAQAEEGAIVELARQPFGKFLLIALAVGLAAYALWRARVAVIGPPQGSGASALGERIGSAALALSYAALCLYTIRFLTDSGGGGGSSTEPDSVTRSLLDEPYGVALVIGIGLVLLALAAFQAHKALTRGFMDELETGRMGAEERRIASLLGTVGHGALALISAISGGFIIKAAVEHEPKEAVGLDGALQELVRQRLGPLLLGVMAACLLTYAAYCLFEARYRKL